MLFVVFVGQQDEVVCAFLDDMYVVIAAAQDTQQHLGCLCHQKQCRLVLGGVGLRSASRISAFSSLGQLG